jgi:hypothetical protein
MYMVVVPRSSVDHCKFITEHDVLKFVGTAATALLVPLLIWMFASMHSGFTELSKSAADLDKRITVLQVELMRYQDYARAEFDVSKAQVRAVGEVVKDFRAEAGELAKAIGARAASSKAAKRR